MALEVLRRERGNHNEVVVLLKSENRNELGMSPIATRLAIEAAQPYLSRAGFNKLGTYGYIPAGTDKMLSEAEMLEPGRVKQGEGYWVQEYHIAGSP